MLLLLSVVAAVAVIAVVNATAAAASHAAVAICVVDVAAVLIELVVGCHEARAIPRLLSKLLFYSKTALCLCISSLETQPFRQVLVTICCARLSNRSYASHRIDLESGAEV